MSSLITIKEPGTLANEAIEIYRKSDRKISLKEAADLVVARQEHCFVSGQTVHELATGLCISRRRKNKEKKAGHQEEFRFSKSIPKNGHWKACPDD